LTKYFILLDPAYNIKSIQDFIFLTPSLLIQLCQTRLWMVVSQSKHSPLQLPWLSEPYVRKVN